MAYCTVCGSVHPCLDKLSSRIEMLEDSLAELRYPHLLTIIERERVFLRDFHAVPLEFRRAARSKERQFTKQVFLGNGRSSEEQVAELRERLDRGLMLLGLMQQPPHPENKEQAEVCEVAYKEGEADLETVVRDLVAALTGKEVEFIYDDKEPEQMV